MKAFIAHSVITILALSWVGTPIIRAEINEWTRLGWPEGGAVQNLVIDPKTPNTLYATGSAYATNVGVGIFKSTNGGANWRAINFGLTTTAVYSLAISRQTPDILYAGTWGSGVFKSIDGGESWAATNLTNTFVNGIAIDPQNPRIVYAATMNGASWAVGGLHKSTDGGISWTKLSPAYLPLLQILAIDPRDPNIVYAGDDGCCGNGGLYKSPDGGVHWTEVPAFSGCFLAAIVIPPQVANALYVTASCDEGSRRHVFKSSDAGASWLPLTSSVPQTSGFSALAIDPQNTDTLYVATRADGVFKSTDGGTSWQAAVPGLRLPSVNALAVDPQNSDRIYIGTGIGVLKSVNAGASWNFANTGLQANSVGALAVDPADSRTIYASSLGEWRFNEFTGGLQYAPGRVFKTTDYATTWNSVNPAAQAATMGLTIARDRSIYVCTTVGLFKSSDAGASWTVLSSFSASGPLGPGGNSCRTVAIDPQTPSTLYAATSSGGVFKSTDGGRSWLTANSGLPTLNNRPMPALTVAVDPATPGKLYVVTDSFVGDPPIPYGFFMSTDGATSWNRVNGLPTDRFIRSLVISARMPGTMYAATSAGLFKSTDSGSNWNSANFGMDASSVFALAIDPQDANTLYAGTTRGLFTITFETPRPPAVDNFQFNQASVRIGDSFVATASGVNLTAQTYFDILFREPGSSVVKEVLNWQTGAASVHSISAGMGLGTWTIIGVRAHEDETDHIGGYVTVSTAVNILADGFR